MINTWWLICNSKEMSHPNPLGNAVRVGDGKTDFLEALADWHKVSGMCGQHILKFLIDFLPRLTFVVQNITIGDLNLLQI